MNHSMATADRATHLRIAAIALVAAFVVTGVALSTRTGGDTATMQTARIIKAGKTTAFAGSDVSTIR